MAPPERLTSMLGGPARFRFIVQPIVAILLGIRDGRNDAKAGRPAYRISVFFVREGRMEALKNGVKAFIKPFFIAVIRTLLSSSTSSTTSGSARLSLSAPC